MERAKSLKMLPWISATAISTVRPRPIDSTMLATGAERRPRVASAKRKARALWPGFRRRCARCAAAWTSAARPRKASKVATAAAVKPAASSLFSAVAITSAASARPARPTATRSLRPTVPSSTAAARNSCAGLVRRARSSEGSEKAKAVSAPKAAARSSGSA